MPSSSIPVREGSVPRQDSIRATSDRTPSQELYLQLGRALKGANSATSGVNQLEPLLEASQRALSRGELQEATQLMRRALSIAPERPDLRAEYESDCPRSCPKSFPPSTRSRRSSRPNKANGPRLHWPGPRFAKGVRRIADAHREAAFALFKVGGDLRGAQKYAQRSCFPRSQRRRRPCAPGPNLSDPGAQAECQAGARGCAKLDPGNEIVKNLLSDLQG